MGVAHVADVPLYVVAGFLGSGKTSLMQRLLDYASGAGMRPGVIVNDFGAVNIDAAQLDRKGLMLTELTGGCVCCTNASQLPPAVKRLLRNRSDLILVETSGLANPIELLDQVTMPWLLPNVILAGVITVVDALGWAMLRAQRELAVVQARCADTLIINKRDLVDPATITQLQGELTTLNPTAHQLLASHAEVDIAALLTPNPHPNPLPEGEGDAIPHIHHNPHIRSLSFSLPAPLDRARFEGFLAGLPVGVLRAKGIVQTSDIAITSIFQYTPGHYNLIPFDISDTELISGVAVIIGSDLDETALQAALHECLA